MRILSESEIVQFNMFRESKVAKDFKRDEMRGMLKKLCGFPGSDQFLMCITQGTNPPILKTKRGVYTVNPKPVYKDRLQEVFRVYHDMVHKEGVRNIKKISIEDAIYVLKNAGYKVLKPVTQYEEV